MKKRISELGKKRKRIFNKLGMTYIELVCALALLSLIVVMFTPMLLSSYEHLYNAGVKVEEVYDSKEQMETGLAVRSSINITNIKVNVQNLFESMNVAGRKIVSDLQGGLETVFHGVRARVDVLSPDVVYDDTSWHEVVIQTTGLDWDADDVILFNLNENRNKNLTSLKDSLKPGQIIIDIVKPDKSKGSSGTAVDEVVYTGGDRASISAMDNGKYLEADPVKKRIEFRIGGVDFTTSPLKICVYYVNERGVLKTLSDYMYIKPAHIIFAGQGGSDYFTTAGIERIDVSSGNTEATTYVLNIEGRGMNVSNSPSLNGLTPNASGSVIKTITWVDNDDNGAFDPYYVMAGTNGSVYRMYSLNVMADGSYFSGTSIPTTATTDKSFNLETGERIHPIFWGGEVSDQYSFQTMNKSTTYGAASDNDVDCSASNSEFGVIGTQYDKFDTKLRYSMVFNSYRTGYKYASQFSRKISYVLTEAANKSFRIAGKKQYLGDFLGYNQRWEPEYCDFVSGGFLSFSANTTDERACYFGGSDVTPSYASNDHTDMHLAYIRLNSYISFDPIQAVRENTTVNIAGGSTATMTDRLITGGEFWCPKGEEEDLRDIGWKDRVNYISTKYGTTANITSAAYLPGASSSGTGQVIYFGTVSAYALVQQRSDTTEKNTKMYNTGSAYASRATFYYVSGTNGAGTTIYRNSSDVNESKSVQDTMRTAITNGTATSKGDAIDFYTGSKGNGTTYKYVDNDLEFTFGYCSRWRMTVGNVTFNGTTEETKSYEKYYKASHASAEYKRKPGINNGNENNLYYSVWFPGEFYNLTQTATLDEVTVAVGYTVSGSTFMSESHDVGDGYYGTALGSIYNDGVLAAYTPKGNKVTNGLANKGKQNVVFQNLLYYKSGSFTNRTTHGRESVRFTVVGLNTETSRSGSSNSGSKQYFAYYGDSNGKLYRSLVATASVSFSAGADENDNVTESVTLVNAIPDSSTSNAATTNGVEEIKFTKTSSDISWGDKSFSSVFAEITSIECHEDIIIVTGKPQPAAQNLFGTAYSGFAVGVKDDNGNWTWKLHAMQFVEGDNKDVYLTDSRIHCAKIIGNYYYAGADGWFGGINLNVLKNLPNGTPVPIAGYNQSVNDDKFLWISTGSNVYAVDGYTTN